MSFFENRLTQQKNKNLWRKRNIDHAHKTNPENPFLSFIDNDYLGLAKHPKIIQALYEGALEYGVGSTSSQLLGGYHAVHKTLEEALADFLGFEQCLLFPSGYQANFSAITTLVQKSDSLFTHRLNHASLIDASLFTRAKIYRFSSLAQLKNQLKNSSSKEKWILTDTVFSMDGFIIPLPDLIELANEFQAKIILDDAHGIGVLGQGGKGCLEHYGIENTQLISLITGGFGKAFGGQGGFIVGNKNIIEYLTQFARGFIYSTGLSPALANAMLSALNLIKNNSENQVYLKNLIQYFKKTAQDLDLHFLPSDTPIQALVLNDAGKTIKISEALKEKNIIVGAIRPPSVPVNQSRLRINLSCRHTEKDIDYLLRTLKKLFYE